MTWGQWTLAVGERRFPPSSRTINRIYWKSKFFTERWQTPSEESLQQQCRTKPQEHQKPDHIRDGGEKHAGRNGRVHACAL